MATRHAHAHHPAVPATPAASGTPTSPQWQALNWSFPFAPVSGNDNDPQTWLSALANSDDGFYPLGSNGMYHGGIHFNTGTGSKLKQGDGIKAIADGEVVAYRLDSTYPELTYPTTPPRYAQYSTGFVLIRHRLVLPPEPNKQGTSSAAATPASGASATTASRPHAYQAPADEVLEFYSLYMHQLDWKGYLEAQTRSGTASAPLIHPLPFWLGDRHFRVGTKANDHQTQHQKGLRICDQANGMVIGLLPRGGELSVVGNVAKGWAQIATIIKGRPVAAVAAGTPDPRAVTGWVNLDELDAVIDPKPRDTEVVLRKPFPVKAGDVVGYLGEYQNSSEASTLPPKREHPLLHVEVFTGARIKDFIAKSQGRAAKLPESEKTLLLIQQGAKLVKPADPQSNAGLAGLTLVLATGTQGDPGKGLWAKVQPMRLAAQAAAHARGHGHARSASGTPVGDPLWVERTKYAGKVAGATVPTWATFPLQLTNAQVPAVGYQQVLSRAQLDRGREIDKATDDQGAQWWSITAGDDEGRTITRWVREKNHPGTLWESPWAWPGFDTVDTTSVPLLDMYRRNLFEVKRLIEGDDEKEFSVVAATVNAGQFIGKLEKAARRQGSGKGNVVPADLRKALTVPWLAAAVSHVIFRYESEWGGDMSKWEKFLPLMGELGKRAWTTEMERIKKLQWWSKVKAIEGFPTDSDAWHIHPIGLIGNFARSAAHPFITIHGQRIEIQFLRKSNDQSLCEKDYTDAAAELGCEARAIKAVAKTETGSSGPYFKPGHDLAFGDDPVPAILFERHLFHRATQGRYDQSHPRISNPAQGGYGAKSIQYEKLMEAYALDPDAALLSASWGRFQILGRNFKAAGFKGVKDYVASMGESEVNQLRAFVSFIKADSVLKTAICNKNWHGFAVRYNGPAQQGYDTTIANNYRDLG